MKKYLFIGMGGFLGANLRFFIKKIDFGQGIPYTTLGINVLGTFIFAVLLAYTLKKQKFNENIRLGLGTGFCGALTTFSTLCKEVVLLGSKNGFYEMYIYLILTFLLGTLAVMLGFFLAKKIRI